MSKTHEEILQLYAATGLRLIDDLKDLLPTELEDNCVAVSIIIMLTSELRLCLLEYEKFITAGKRTEADMFMLWASNKILSETTRLGRRLTINEIQKIKSEDANRPLICARCGWKDVFFNFKRVDEVFVCLQCAKKESAN